MAKISKAIQAFQDWERPWTFESKVSESLESGEEALLFKQLWDFAISFENWAFQSGLRACAESLREKFDLDTGTASEIARAAAYSWR